jgi:hypothetical protein
MPSEGLGEVFKGVSADMCGQSCAEVSEDPHLRERQFFSLSSGSLLILPEGVVIGIQIFAWAPK